MTNLTPKPWDDDQRLMEDLAEALRAVSSSASLVAERGRGAWAWRNVDEELLVASLSFDSMEEPVSALRGESRDARTMVFTAAPLSIELEVNGRGALGQVVPPAEGDIYVEASDGTVTAARADDLGFFVLAAVPEGPVRLRLETATGRLVTQWVRL